MQNILAIWQREMKSYFVSPIAYVVLTVFLFITGLFFFGYVAQLSSAQMGQIQQAIDVPGIITRGLFNTISVVLLFIVPMLTMGLFAEEKKRGTIELLLTTPVGNLQTLIGKYLASLAFLLLMLLGSAITIFPLFVYSKPELKPVLSGYLGLFLFGSAMLAVGLFISTLTENQIVAVIITFGVSLVLWLVEIFAPTSGAAKSVVSYLSVISHLEDFIKGVIDSTHVIFYVTFAFVGLFLAYRSLESMRWKG